MYHIYNLDHSGSKIRWLAVGSFLGGAIMVAMLSNSVCHFGVRNGMPTLSFDIWVDSLNWVSGAKIQAAFTWNSARKTAWFIIYLICSDGAIYKIVCFDEHDLNLK